MSQLRLIPDVPVGEGIKDGLDFAQYADILACAALDTPEPFTIGVYGGWGSGKTSLMRMIMDVVRKDKGAIPVWFNAWRYEREEHLIVPLLATIIAEMDARASKLTTGLANGLKGIRDALRSVLYGISVKGKIGIPGLTEAELSISPKDMFDKYEKLSDMATEQILDRSLYFHSFARLDETARQVRAPKLIVFVDDLDRCFPDKAVALLEGIKLVLNQPNFTFILGVAPLIVRAYLAAKYKKDYAIPENLYEDYLDKLVQLPFQIPGIQQNAEAYVRSLLKQEDVFGKIAAKDFREQYEPLAAICGPACRNNPRAIVRFLNRLLILTRINERKRRESGGTKTQISFVHFGITNALDMKWPAVLEACEMDRRIPVTGTTDERPLCEVLTNILSIDAPDREIIPKLETYISDSCPVRDVFKLLVADESLRSLLKSEPGRKWLSQPDLRKEAAATTREVTFDLSEADAAVVALLRQYPAGKAASTDKSVTSVDQPPKH